MRIFFRRALLSLALIFQINFVSALELSPQRWAFEIKGGLFFPTNDVFQDFIGKLNGYYELRLGYLHDSKFQFDFGVGLLTEKGKGIGSITGQPSAEVLRFTALPFSISATVRGDYLENQVLVPYLGIGLDAMFYRESLAGNSDSGWKFGYHAHAGLQLLLEVLDPDSYALEEMGVNDVYLTLEGRWTHIDDFGGEGFNFSGFSVLMGLLFEF